MSDIQFLLDRLSSAPGEAALLWRGEAYSGGWLCRKVAESTATLGEHGIQAGSVTILSADYSPATVALLLALIHIRAIVVPLLPATLERSRDLVDIAAPDSWISVGAEGEIAFAPGVEGARHELTENLKQQGKPGLILFTSGSTGKAKGVLHDLSRLLSKFETRRPAFKTLNFLLFDHWGGLNTLFHSLSNHSPLILPERRTPEYICDLLERHRVELLPASPTFLNMLLLSRAHEGRDLSALKLITYGSEPMPASTLKWLRAALPHVELRQTYGLIELGVLRAKSQSSDSLWVKVGGEGYDLRVIDGILQIKAESAMLGYLNAPSPFTADGYFITGDRVEIDGDYMRFLGRDSELINVGGQKVFPAEVETVLLECEEIEDAVVYGQRHPIIGHIVCADVQLRNGLDETEARRSIKRFCAGRLDAFKVPVKINFVREGLHSDRLKRLHIGRDTPNASKPV